MINKEYLTRHELPANTKVVTPRNKKALYLREKGVFALFRIKGENKIKGWNKFRLIDEDKKIYQAYE